MEQYIKKSEVLAEIEKKLQDLIICKENAFYAEKRITLQAKINMCKEILSLLDTIEVKEVDLGQEIKKYIKDNICGYCIPGVEETAKHFFELGIKSQKGD